MTKLSKLKTVLVSPEYLYLDVDNPRFSCDEVSQCLRGSFGNFSPRVQEALRRYLLEKHAASDLVKSILRVGFLKIDRVIVQHVVDDKYVVIEGNRRIAALKSILGDIRRRIISPSRQILETIFEIDVLCLDTSGNLGEKEKLLLQGVRHISGVRNWGPYQQGRLIYALVENEGLNFSEAASAVGLSQGRVSTLLRSYCGMRQMECHPEFAASAEANLFSCFEQAYLKLPVRNWLAWSEDEKAYSNQEALRFFYKQIEHRNTGPKIIAREVRDLLPIVLEHDEAKSVYLEGKATLSEAFVLTQPHNEYLEPFLKSADGLMKRFTSGIHQSDLNLKDRALLEKIHLFTGKILQKQLV